MTNLILYRVHARKNFGTTKRWSEYDGEWYYEDDTNTIDHLFHGADMAWQKYRKLCNAIRKTNVEEAEVCILRKIIPIDRECEIGMDLDSWFLIERTMIEGS